MTEKEIAFFDGIAPDWDAMEVKSTPEKVRAILGLIGPRKGDHVLDLGTGTGVLVPYLSEMVGPEGEVTGVDISEGMLERARQKFGSLANVRFIKSDFEEENIDGLYNLILLYCVFPHIHFPVETLRWLTSVNLAEGGRIVIAFPNDEKFVNAIHGEKRAPADMLPDAPELAARLRRAGFQADVIAYSEEMYIVEIRSSRCF